MSPGALAARGVPLLVAGLLAAGCNELDPMREQPKYLPYERNPFFADQMAMRPTPPGTVPREQQLGPPELTRGRDAQGRYVEQIPLPVTPELLAEGRARFEIICATCHGVLGDGNSVPAQKMSLRPPPSLHRYVDRADGYLYAVVTEGFGMMPDYRAELSLEQRWAVVAYVRALQLSQRARLEQAPPEERRRLEEARR